MENLAAPWLSPTRRRRLRRRRRLCRCWSRNSKSRPKESRLQSWRPRRTLRATWQLNFSINSRRSQNVSASEGGGRFSIAKVSQSLRRRRQLMRENSNSLPPHHRIQFAQPSAMLPRKRERLEPALAGFDYTWRGDSCRRLEAALRAHWEPPDR